MIETAPGDARKVRRVKHRSPVPLHRRIQSVSKADAVAKSRERQRTRGSARSPRPPGCCRRATRRASSTRGDDPRTSGPGGAPGGSRSARARRPSAGGGGGGSTRARVHPAGRSALRPGPRWTEHASCLGQPATCVARRASAGRRGDVTAGAHPDWPHRFEPAVGIVPLTADAAREQNDTEHRVSRCSVDGRAELRAHRPRICLSRAISTVNCDRHEIARLMSGPVKKNRRPCAAAALSRSPAPAQSRRRPPKTRSNIKKRLMKSR
jgi:hypothetical protein